MQELIDKLKAEAGLTDEQAKKAIETIKNFVVENSQCWKVQLIMFSAATKASQIGEEVLCPHRKT